jgi:hypothetical protein
MGTDNELARKPTIGLPLSLTIQILIRPTSAAIERIVSADRDKICL